MTPSRSEAARRATRWVPILATATAMAAASPAGAEVVVNEDEFRDWVGRCETETTTGEVICFIYTGRVAEVEGESLAARLVIGLGDEMSPIVYLDLPDTAEPANGFMLQVDSQEPFSGRFSNCSTGWCHTQATGDIANELIRQFRAGSQATASFILEGKEVRVDLPLSLLGFTAAYERLVQIHARAAANTAEEAEGAAAEDAEPAAEDEAAQTAEPGAEGADEPAADATPADETPADETPADETPADPASPEAEAPPQDPEQPAAQ